MMRLLALEGAITGIKSNDLSDTTKANLKVFCRQFKPARR
jgi:hypothetical protein